MITANGVNLAWARLTIPWSGRQIFEGGGQDEVVPVNGGVTFTMGNVTMVATLIPKRSGMFAGSWRGYAVSGRNGWQKRLSAKGYQSPFGVIAAQVIADAARESGELPPAVSAPFKYGEFFARSSELSASQVFDKLPDGVTWWVDGTGVTQVGIRPPMVVTSPFEILTWDTGKGRLTIATDDPASFVPNATFTDPVAGPITVNAVIWHSSADKFRGEIWTA